VQAHFVFAAELIKQQRAAVCSLPSVSLALGKKKRKGEKETLCKALLLSTHYGDSGVSVSVALGLR